MEGRYKDKISYYVDTYEVALRPGSIEINRNRGEYYATRIYRSGVWTIISSTSGVEPPVKTTRIARPTPLYKMLSNAKLYQGRSTIGNYSPPDENTIKEFAEAILATAPSTCRIETIATILHEVRSITHPEGAAREERNYTDILLAVQCGNAALSTRIGFQGPLDRMRIKSLTSIAESLAYNTLAYQKARRLNPVASGKWILILANNASGAFLHEIGHLLEASSTSSLTPGEKIAPPSVNIVEDPYYYDSPASRAFDDEAVEAKRKKLVENGVVIERLNTRETAYITGEAPGNANGLFHRPIPGHTTLVLKKGDWKFSEIIEETRRAILVTQIVEAFVDDNRVITLVPEDGWIVERGEIVKPVRLSRIRLRVPSETTTIDAISRDQWLRIASEKGTIVAEAAPTIRLTGFID